MNPVVIVPEASQSTNTDPDWRLTHRIDGIVTGVLHSCFGRLHEYKCLHFLSGSGERGGSHFFVFMMNWTFRTTWLWWWRWWWWCWWITMTIYSTELFQALSRLLRRRLSCFWFIFYYVSAMFIKRDTVIINKTTFTIMSSLVCVRERERQGENGVYAVFVCRI